MAGRIVLFGATGYTGRLTADALVERGARPVLAARSVEPLRRMGDDLGGLEIAVADVSRPDSVRGLLEEGDVLLTTVGPFVRYGDAAAEAAVTTRAHYLDSTGEPPFIRRVFEEYGPRAERAGIAMLTALGYDWVPGNLAGALALRDAEEEAVRVRIGYFLVGSGNEPSGGTRASSAAALAYPGFAWRDGRIVTERTAKRYAAFDVDGRRRPAVSAGASEHFGLPRAFPRVREVDVYLGWFGSQSRAIQAAAAWSDLVTRVPGVRAGMDAVAGRFVRGSSGGPGPEERSRGGSHVVAVACDSGGRRLAEVHLTGVNGYDFTARFLAGAAMRIADGAVEGSGALGPVEAFGTEGLEEMVREAGLERA
ncbi:MAG TPA: saccharopine dehydrogenase NADP-binding domain-containing protein [Thermoleophilaceae bacterium]|jgi:short subunit dehydrogenase-like uncharacterized protein